MGWDITYHPVGADEVRSIYFAGLADRDFYKSLVTKFGVHDFYTEQLRKRFEEARNLESDVPFNKGHGFYVAIISGFLRKHHYLRGAAFSFLAFDPAMTRYVGRWESLVPEGNSRVQHIDNCLTENYSAGVFLPNEALKALRKDYGLNPEVRAKMDEVFSHGRLAVFWKAVDEAVENGLGLVEASEVVEPNPLDLNASRSLTNLFNCHLDGPMLYQQSAMEQLSQAMETAPAAAPEKKSGFFSRLFGK
jgi:hypothetical protein